MQAKTSSAHATNHTAATTVRLHMPISLQAAGLLQYERDRCFKMHSIAPLWIITATWHASLPEAATASDSALKEENTKDCIS